ncbi:hypothetical protein [Sphingomonas xanthus]|uniref:Uncharacterized protein n=1 Tax=Sphingomonas xanthus TaxID=2594473 RepID=A0A516IU13_9SPHN|nr:hypothetical protein [Sphingomonas xanthus]QDP20371.1 hypothetical protein FMM02_10660 [Sphingomonas xanthus]
MDNVTPETAIVEANINGLKVEIDFLGHVKGVKDDKLEQAAVELVLNVRLAEGRTDTIRVPIMHPLHCLQSRLSNVVSLGRKDDTSKRQLEASSIVLREYISETLDDGEHRDATQILETLFEYLRSDVSGRRAHLIMNNDPALVLEHFADDSRIDERYRANTLANMRRQLAKRRTAWATMAARMGQALGLN